MAEESKNPTKTIPKAIMWTTITAGIVFVGLSYLGHLVLPSHAFTDVDSAALDVMTTAGGQFLATFFTAAYVSGALGSALASQASVSRILFAMGRDGVLPRSFFGRIVPRFQTPVYAILAVSVISLIALVIDLGVLAEMISFGALIAFSVVNLTVIKHYFFGERRRGGAASINYLVLPVIGFILTVWLWTSLAPRTLLIGAVWLAVGFGYLLVITRGFRRQTPMLDLRE
jgi:putrescine importer